MTRPQPVEGAFARALDVLKISESVVSAITITLTGFALAIGVLYALALTVGGTESLWFVLAAFAVIPFMIRLIYGAAAEEDLGEIKRNRVFETALLLVTLLRDALAAIVLFRLVLYGNVLLGDEGVEKGWRPLWDIVRQVVVG